MIDILSDFALESWGILNEAAPWVLLGFTVAALVKAFVSDEFISRHLGRNGATSVVKASVIGVPLPLCSCGVVPAAFGLRRQGASKGATTAFLISTPETGADSMAVTWALLDPVMTVMRPIAAFLTATFAGLAVNMLPDDEAGDVSKLTAPASSCGCGCGCGSSTSEPTTLGGKLRDGFQHAFGEMLADIGKWLILGIFLAAAISLFVPETFFEEYLGNEWMSMLVMLVAGVPLYICATSSTPIAASLALKGLSPGAALVFLLSGPATNAATITVVAKTLGRGAAIVYVGSIAVSSLALGWVINRVYGILGLDITSWVATDAAEGVTWFTAASSALLLVLVGRAMLPSRNGHHDHDHSHDHSHEHEAASSGCGCCGSTPSPAAPQGSISASDFKVR